LSPRIRGDRTLRDGASYIYTTAAPPLGPGAPPSLAIIRDDLRGARLLR
jgi:hypothetical protein